MRKCLGILLCIFLILLSTKAWPARADTGNGRATLTVVTQVSNTNGGVAKASDFTVHISSVTGAVYSTPGSESGITYTLDAGIYTVSEDVYAGYTASFSGDCDSSGAVTLGPGDNKTVTITNRDQPAGPAILSTTMAPLEESNLPTVTGVSPSGGYPGGGTFVTIKGRGFTDAKMVYFGANNPANNFTVVDDGTITCNAPHAPFGVSTVDVIVATTTSASTPNDNAKFTYWPPVVKSVYPNHGPDTGGTLVTISGNNFINGETTVSFGDIPAAKVDVKSDQAIWAISPPGQGTVDVLVTTNGVTSTPNDNDKFTYKPTLKVLSTYPSDGATEVSPDTTEIKIIFNRPIQIPVSPDSYNNYFGVHGKYCLGWGYSSISIGKTNVDNDTLIITPALFIYDDQDPEKIVKTMFGLPVDDTVTVTVNQGGVVAADDSAVTLDKQFSFSFKTQAVNALTPFDDQVLEQAVRHALAETWTEKYQLIPGTFQFPSDRQIYQHEDPYAKVMVQTLSGENVYVPIPAMDDLTSLQYPYEPDQYSGAMIQSISELVYAPNLQHLTLNYSSISDLTPLQGLTQLRKLELSGNPFGTADLTLLANLTQLEQLNLNNCHISDLTGLAGIGSSLTSLDLSGNEISDIRPLASLTGLQTLLLSNNRISDISSLAGLTDLTRLDLSGNQVSNVCALSGLTSLTYLNLDSTALDDTGLSQIDWSALSKLQTLHLADNYIADITPLKKIPTSASLVELDLSNNCLTDDDLAIIEDMNFQEDQYGNLPTVNVIGNQDLDPAVYFNYVTAMWDKGVLTDYDSGYAVRPIYPGKTTPLNEEVAVDGHTPIRLIYDFIEDEQPFDLKRLESGNYLSKVKVYVNGVYNDDLTKSLKFTKTSNSIDPDTGNNITIMELDHDSFPSASTITIVGPLRLVWYRQGGTA